MQFTKLLKFSYSNGKLDDRFIFSIPAGYSCPRAGVCRTFANRETGKILDKPKGDQIDYRCFAAMSEARSPQCRQLRWHNYEAITKQCGEDALLISMLVMDSIRQSHRNYELFRIHEAGDMFSDAYFRSWILTAGVFPEIKFYAYTKSLNYWLHYKDHLPSNLYLTASLGGELDHLVTENPDVFKRTAQVVYSQEEADQLGLEIDHDDSHCFGDKPFALLIHGVQRAGSSASKAVSVLKKNGINGYNKMHRQKA
tara:strand:+ start:1593 stop:2354 length:762 start_codon:yes stop_codon:yes gene_type:complete